MENNFSEKQFIVAMHFVNQASKDDTIIKINYNDSVILLKNIDGKLTPLATKKEAFDGLMSEDIRNILFNKCIEIIKDTLNSSNTTSFRSEVEGIKFIITLKDKLYVAIDIL